MFLLLCISRLLGKQSRIQKVFEEITKKYEGKRSERQRHEKGQGCCRRDTCEYRCANTTHTREADSFVPAVQQHHSFTGLSSHAQWQHLYTPHSMESTHKKRCVSVTERILLLLKCINCFFRRRILLLDFTLYNFFLILLCAFIYLYIYKRRFLPESFPL